MPDATTIMQSIATHLGTALQISELHTYPLHEKNPTPPAIDVYPADPFFQQTAYTLGASELAFTVRARVNGDDQAQQTMLIGMMDPTSNTSLVHALDGQTLGGTVSYVYAEPPTEFQLFTDPGGTGEGLLGCTWRTRVGL